MSYSFGNYICKLREKKQLTQAQLGERLGVSGKAVSKWENGGAYPSSDLIYPLASALDTSVEELYRVMRDNRRPASRLRVFLDKVFAKPTIKIALLLFLAVSSYLLFALFGQGEDKRTPLIGIPFLCVLVFGVVYLLLWVQLKNPLCPAKFLNLFEVIFLIGLLICTVSLTVQFLSDLRFGYTFSLPCCLCALAGLTLFHSRRNR